MNTILKKVVSLVLCFVLMTSYLPTGAFAAETEEAVTAETTAVTEEPTQVASEETEAPSESTEEPTEQSEQTDASAKEEKKSEKESQKAEKEAEKEAKQEKTVSAEETSGVLTASAETAAISAEAVAPSTEATEPEVIAVTGITLDQTELEVSVGELPMTLTATVLPENATDKTVTWESSEPGVASVEDGVLTFGYMGKAVITATAGEFSASCTVTVDEGEWSGYSNDEIDYLFVATDRHANTSVIGNVINNMESAIGENELDYLALGGDMVGSGSSHPTYNSSTVLSEVTGATSSLSAANVDIVAGIHDMNVTDDSDIVLPYSGGGAQIYKGDKFYVYGVPEGCISGAVSGVDPATEAQAFMTWANGVDDSKVIILVSHYPLHAKRGDNVGAGYWHNALNTVATGSATGTEVVRNVVFFHGHNHTVDSTEYCYAPGSTVSIESYVEPSGVAAAAESEIMSVYDDEIETYASASGTNATIYYTYATAGYLNQNSKATLVTITDDTVSLTKYSTSGSGTAMASVERVAEAAPTLTSIAISGNTSYTVGDELALTVTATYSDGTTANVTADATLSGYDMNTVGTHTVTASYAGLTAEYAITVSDPVMTKIEITTLPTTVTYDKGDELSTAGMVVTATYDNGTTADVTEKAYVFGTVDMTTAGEKTVTIAYSDNGIIFKATYTITVNDTLADDMVLTALEIITAPAKTEYLLNDALDITGMVVKATFSDGTNTEQKELTYAGFINSEVEAAAADTYAYYIDGFNMHVEKQQTVTVSYTYGEVTKTATFTINVWHEEFTDESTGVKVSVADEDYGVTAVNVSPSTNSHVAAAVADYMKDGTVTAYDITLTLDADVNENGEAVYGLTDGEKTVTLPIPEGVSNPVVYYVSDDGETVEDMNAVKDGNGYVAFTTTHFSTYVIGESTEITVPDAEIATGSGSTTTTTTKTVYVLTSSISSGNEYLIVNGNSAGSYYALANNSGSVAATGVTVKTDSEIGTYIELDDATDELWTVSNSYRFQNEGYYLRYNNGLGLSTSSYTNWSYSDNNLSCTNGRNTYYLRYNSGWTTTSRSGSASDIYFYIPTEIEVETTTTVSGTYSIAGEDITKVVVEGTTVDLKSTLTFTPSGGSPATTTDTSDAATYTVVDGGDPNGIISGISGNTVTFSGTYGKALVQVSWDVQFGEETKTVTNYIIVEATEPTYTLEITKDDVVVSGTTVAIKGVTNGQTLQLGTNVFYETAEGTTELETLPEGATIEWHIPEEYQIFATVDHDTGLLTFKGVTGAFYVTATLTVDGKDYTVGVNISASTSQYSIPSDGTTDFPEYPNEGAIRYDKTATAVGNFSETGIAQVELSMTGVPYTTGSEIDVVIMLDMTGSMSETAMTAAEESAIAFAEQIVKNADGTYNSNRIAVLAFNSSDSSPFTYWSLGTITADQWDSFCTAVRGASDDQTSGGTPYDEALQECQSILAAAKSDGIGNNRQQYCVFVSDGGPTSYEYITNYDAVKAGTSTVYETDTATATGGANQSDSNFATIATYTHEYYSTVMKDNGVTMFSVLTGLSADDYPNCATILENIASSADNAYVVEDGSDTSALTGALSDIAMKILQAATNVTVEDQLGENYTMIFDIPTTTTEGGPKIEGVTNDFYIEFLKYELDENHERTTSTSVTKLYLKNTDGVLSAAKDSDGTAYDAPVFEQKTVGDKGTLYYWSTNAADGDTDISVTVDGTTYYFVSYGMKEAGYNMTSGGYAHGTVGADNMSGDLLIATPYFVYNAATKMLYWTVDKLDTYEYALRYFVYLNNSATEVGTDNEADPGSYLTNEYAYITYTNFNGNDCRQEFPKPQMTWSGAQVSYVFYLVNAAGQPINKSGQVVDFANATFITDIYTESTVWNKGEDGKITADSQLSIDWLAKELLPSDYLVYDMNANYQLHVYGDHTGESIFDYFTIDGDEASNISNSLNERLNLNTTENTVSLETTKVYNTKAGTKYDDYGTYTSKATDSINGEIVLTDFDFYNTTVAFAVVWQPRLVPDTVVVDYGLDVLINVVQNDILQNTLSGIGVGADAYGNIAMNTGVSTTSKLGTAALTIEGNTISIENENSVRFHQGDMQFDKPVEFYYETPVEFWEGSDPTEGFMYSSVTVVPATTIYYEDSFIDLTVWSYDDAETPLDEEWETVGTTTSATQDQDRPGESQISGSIDADNVYGYDGAYKNCSTYSMGSARKVTVDDNQYAEAQFTFYGTGFDVISLTSNTTGTITVDVYNGTNVTYSDDNREKSLVVDTFYGYKQNDDGTWEVDSESTDALYQVPVMKVEGLEYGQYTVVITAAYYSGFDHTDDGSYDFYLDAIRIYDPTGNENDVANKAYTDDGEGWPTYFEVRNEIIDEHDADQLGQNEADGIVFIDGNDGTASVADYTSYGPNNETYLATRQAIAFELDATAAEGTAVAKVQLAVKTVGGDASIKVYSTDGTTALDADITTATDMYYDITALNGKTVIIVNDGESGILSITNVKVTYTDAQSSTETSGVFMLRRSSVDAALATMNEVEEVPETSEPEISEPETSEPETTEPEETEPTPTIPEDVEEAVKEVVQTVVKTVENLLKNLFSKWFR